MKNGHSAESKAGQSPLDESYYVEHNGLRVARGWTKKIKKAQEQATYRINGRLYERLTYEAESTGKADSGTPCPGCAVSPGQYHVSGCEYERCPACRLPATTCDCAFEDE